MAKKNKNKINAALKKITESHHIDALVQAIVSEMGGVKALAKTFKTEFTDSPTGSPVKARMLDALMTMIETRSKDDQAETMELISDEDLDRVIEELMEQEIEELGEDAGE